MQRKGFSNEDIIRDENWMQLRAVSTPDPGIRQIVDLKRRIVMANVRIVPQADLSLTQSFMDEMQQLLKGYYARSLLRR